MKALTLLGTLMAAATVATAGEWRDPVWGPAFADHPDLAVTDYDRSASGAVPERSFITSLERIQMGNPDGYPHPGAMDDSPARNGGPSWITSLERIYLGNPDGYPHPVQPVEVGDRVSGGASPQEGAL